MSDNPHRTTYVRETERTRSGSGMAFAIGGLVVAVAFILWLVFGGPADDSVAPGDTTNISVGTPAADEPAAPEPAATTGTPTDPVADPVADSAPAAPEAEPADAPAPAGN